MMIRSLIASGVIAVSLAAPSMAQVTSVTQLRDVQPTDWSYQALSNLISRYGCVAGYPNGTFKPGQPATRAELSALTNHCLDNITAFYTEADAKLAAALRAQIGAVSNRVTKLEVVNQRRQLGVGNYGGVAFAGNAANYPGVNGGRLYESGITLQGRVKAFDLGNQYSISARPYVTLTSTPNYVSGGVFGGGVATLDIPVARRTLADGTKVSSANIYLGAGGQAGGNQNGGIGVAGAEVSVANNVVLFADAKVPFSNTGAEYRNNQGYNVTGTVGLGFKF